MNIEVRSSKATYEELFESIEDYQFGIIVKERQNEKISAIADIAEL